MAAAVAVRAPQPLVIMAVQVFKAISLAHHYGLVAVEVRARILPVREVQVVKVVGVLALIL